MGGGRPAVLAGDPPGGIEVFQRAVDGTLRHIFQTPTSANQGPPGAFAGAWQSLAGVLVGDPVAANVLGGSGETLRATFHRGTDGACWFRNSQTPDPAGAWTNWTSLGGTMVGDPVVAANGDDRLEVFHRGTDNRLYHRWQSSSRNPAAWAASWETLGGSLAGQPAAIRNSRGGTSVFHRSPKGELMYRFFDPPAGTWSAWQTIATGLTGDPSVTLSEGLAPVVAFRGARSAVFWGWQPGDGAPLPSAPWRFTQIGGTAPGDPLVSRATDVGNPVAFYRGMGSELEASDMLT
jgi:hypothetical protein